MNPESHPMQNTHSLEERLQGQKQTDCVGKPQHPQQRFKLRNAANL